MIKKIINKLINEKKFVRGDTNKNDIAGTLNKCWGYCFSNHFLGDYVEFGLYHGDSFQESIKQYNLFMQWVNSQLLSDEKWRVEIAKNSIFLNNKPVFHGLDTFEGMPQNKEGNIIFKEKNFIANFKDVKKKIERVANKKIDYRLYKGLFIEKANDLKNSLGDKQVAIINFDCDLESSTEDSLSIIKNNIGIGTILLFDDYNAFNSNNKYGQRKAFNEFSKKQI